MSDTTDEDAEGAAPSSSSTPAPPAVVQDILYRLGREVVDGLNGAKLVDHPGEGGRARENIVADALRRFIPDTHGVSTGFVIDALGGRSRQQDIVIFRRGYHPVFTVGGINYFMVEGVSAVIQNKAANNIESEPTRCPEYRGVGKGPR